MCAHLIKSARQVANNDNDLSKGGEKAREKMVRCKALHRRRKMDFICAAVEMYGFVFFFYFISNYFCRMI